MENLKFGPAASNKLLSPKNVSLLPLLLAFVPILFLLRKRLHGQRDKITLTSRRSLNSAPLPSFDTVQVSKILIHPIKSCRGTSVQSAVYTPQGLEHDRTWTIIEAADHDIITARKEGKMVLIHPKLVFDSTSAFGGRLEVSFPQGSDCQSFSVPLRPTSELLKTWECIDDITFFHLPGIHGYICQSTPESPSSPSPSAELSKYFGRPVHLVYQGPKLRACDTTQAFPELDAKIRYQDGYPLLFISEESLESVQSGVRPLVGVQGVAQEWAEKKLEIERFRPNIVIRGAGIPFAEDMWREVAFVPDGSRSADAPSIAMVSRCSRCLLPNVDTSTGVRDAAVPFKVLMKVRSGLEGEQKNQAMFGCNAAPQGEGVVSVGDHVYVRKTVV